MSDQGLPLDQSDTRTVNKSWAISDEVSGATTQDKEKTVESDSADLEPDGNVCKKAVKQLIHGCVEPASDIDMPKCDVDAKVKEIVPNPQSDCYDMTHQERGYALVFNQEKFSYALKQQGFSDRSGTNEDERNVTLCLKKFGFRVQSYNDLTANQMKTFCEKMAKLDHSNCDMFLCVILSHGEDGVVYGTDRAVEMHELSKYFKGSSCPSLIGKPKIFIIQACRGFQTDPGVNVNVADALRQGGDHHSLEIPDIKLPMEVDFLFAYSTVPGYYSWRNGLKGSWFIQAFCNALSQYGEKVELRKLLTIVNKIVAQNFQSNNESDPLFHNMKQIPSICSMLTKDVFFPKKIKHVY